MALLQKVKVLGMDIGNNSTKTSEGVCFVSQVEQYDVLTDESCIKVKWNDNFYIVGESSTAMRFTSIDKVDTDEYKVCVLLSVALSYMDQDRIDIIASIGLPYEVYGDASVVDHYKNTIEELKEEKITIYFDESDKVGIEKIINIVECKVNKESDLKNLFIDENGINEDMLPAIVVDFGGGTLDITSYTVKTIFDQEKKKSIRDIDVKGLTEKNLGFDIVLDRLRKDLDNKGYTAKTTQEVIATLGKETLFGVREEINYKAMQDKHMKSYSSRIARYLANNNIGKCNSIYYIGGCADFVLDSMKKYGDIPKNREDRYKVLEDSQFRNALNFEENARKDVDLTKYRLDDEE